MKLKYGCNPHQKANLTFAGNSPLQILNGCPGYINILDALSAWQLVKEMKRSTGIASATSFKHVSPAGAAIAKPLDDNFIKSQFIPEGNYSKIATAYIRARSCDRVSSYGDAIAVSEKVDISLANYIKAQVSDLIIAPEYEIEALEILKSKKNGKYLILKINKDYDAPNIEKRTIFGFSLQQETNNIQINETFFKKNLPNKNIANDALLNLIIGNIVLKHTISNSVVIVYDGMTIGIGAGQQSRIQSTRIACNKADNWFLSRHPKVLNLKFKKELNKTNKINIINQFLNCKEKIIKERYILKNFTKSPESITLKERISWNKKFDNIALCSDAFIPFRDNIDRASYTNVKYISHEGGSIRDEKVRKAAQENKIMIIRTGVRLFRH